MGRREWKRWAREQRRVARDAMRELPGARDKSGNSEAKELRDLERRVLHFRRGVVQTVVLIPLLFLINFAVQGFPWFIFPSVFLLLISLMRAGLLWADGVSPIDALRSGWRERLRAVFGAPPTPAAATALPAPVQDPAAALVPVEVLNGVYGNVVRRAAADRAQVQEIVAKLSTIEKEMLPDVRPTADGLLERVASIAVTVHRLDADVSGTSLAALDERIARFQKESEGPDIDRRLALLQRQRATLRDLLERRRTLVNQLESASLALQNLKLDLLKLRSAGVGSAIEDVTSATREARALSKDIAHLLDAADDVRKL
jgi:serine/threonine-protein kinase